MTGLADGYSTAIFEVARAEGVLETVEKELFELAHALGRSDALRQALGDPVIPVEKRHAIVEDLLGGKASALTMNILLFLVGVGRVKELPDIIARLVERSAADRQHAVAEVRSATPLSADQRERLAEALSANLGKQVEVKVVVDPSVLGGLSARVGDIVIDGTVRHRLDQLKEAI
ncbi:MAG: ATP synthase F1 subunit delta [Acidimicrobiales bacterium]